jgi:hypothetical protein
VFKYVQNNHTLVPSKGRHRVYTYFGDVMSLCRFPALVTAFRITMELTVSATLILFLAPFNIITVHVNLQKTPTNCTRRKKNYYVSTWSLHQNYVLIVLLSPGCRRLSVKISMVSYDMHTRDPVNCVPVMVTLCYQFTAIYGSN